MALKSPLTFLRPLALPRSSTVHSFFQGCRSLTTTSAFRNEITTIQTPSIKSPLHIPLTSNKPIDLTPSVEPSKTPANAVLPLTDLPYRVLRTPNKNLPIYLLRQRGGNLHLTRIRKIEGDKQAMVRDLTIALELDKPISKRGLRRGTKTERAKARLEAESTVKRIWINPVTGHIMLKGHLQAEVTKFLTDRSF